MRGARVQAAARASSALTHFNADCRSRAKTFGEKENRSRLGRGRGEEFSRKERRAKEASPLSHLAKVDEAKRGRKARTVSDGERKVRAHDES